MQKRENVEPEVLPEFIIGGAMKSATSSLHHILSQHDQVYLPDREIHFFCMDDVIHHSEFFFPVRESHERAPDYERDFDQNLEWYTDFFTSAGTDQLTGDYSTTYLCSAAAPERISALIPEVKLLFMLRNPVDRTYSHYWHRVKTGRAVRNFEHELQHGPSTLLLRSFYKSQLENYLQVFARDQIKVVMFEDFIRETQDVVNDVCSFLDLPASIDTGRTSDHQNKSPRPRFLYPHLLFNYLTGGLENRYGDHLPASEQPLSDWVLQGTVHHLRNVNLTSASPPPMSESTRDRLAQLFARKNRGLGELIGVDLEKYWPRIHKHQTA